MAKDKVEPEVVDENANPVKPSEETTEATGKTPDDSPSKKDIEDVISLLNEVDVNQGGKGNISGITAENHRPIKYLIERLSTVVNMYDDPLYKDVLDDMHEQGE